MHTSVLQAAEDIEFIGFSGNDQMAAWILQAEAPHAEGALDHYSLVRLTDSRTDATIALFRVSTPYRTVNGHRIAVSAQALAAANPPWQTARSQADWLHYKRLGHFQHIKLPLTDNSVQVVADKGCSLTITVHKSHLLVQAAAGQPLGFTLLGRFSDAHLEKLATVHQEGPPSLHPRATVDVFISHSGRAVGVIKHIVFDDPDRNLVSSASMVSKTTALGTTSVGELKREQETEESFRDLFLQLHPNSAKDFDRYGAE